MGFPRSCSAAVALLSALSGTAWADRLDDSERATALGTQVSLRSGVIDTRAPGSIPEGLRVGRGDGSDDYVLVKYSTPITASERQALEAASAAVYTYLPHFTFLVRKPPTISLEGLRGALGAGWVGPYHPAYKMSPAVTAAADQEMGPLEMGSGEFVRDQPIATMVHVYPDANLPGVVERLRAAGIERVSGTSDGGFFSRIRVLLNPVEIVEHRETIARIPEVFWIDLEPRRVLLNDTTIWVGQSGLDGGQTTPVFDRGIFGEGEIIAVLDTGLDAGMCYFRDPDLGLPPTNPCDFGTEVDTAQRKVIAVDFLWGNECAGGINDTEWDTQDHGTHVAGTAAGDNLATPLGHDPGDGMAPGAQLVIQDGGFQTDNCADLPGLGCPVVDLNPIFQQAYDQGARLHTNSWGDQENFPIQNLYTTGSQDADEFMWEHPDFLLFFAAGNSGSAAGTVSSPSTAKSVVSVGATQRGAAAGSMANFSSCGPTDDGRIKPEVTAPGSSIVSANNDGNASTQNCNTRSLSGTSMATPAAAGLAALIRQYYADGWYPSGSPAAADSVAPSAALVKASLINSARDMAGAGAIPNNCQGWGRATLDDVLYFDGDSRRLWVGDDTTGFPLGAAGAQADFLFEVESAAEALKITLAWTDFPSTPAADPHINNDLDLVVIGPEGTFLGNVFSGGQSTPGGAADRLNTVEQVLLSHPIPGEYTVRVSAFNVPNGPQPYALVVTGDISVGGGIFEDGFESGDLTRWSAAE